MDIIDNENEKATVEHKLIILPEKAFSSFDIII